MGKLEQICIMVEGQLNWWFNAHWRCTITGFLIGFIFGAALL